MHKPSLLERLRAKKQSPRPALGLAWYDEAARVRVLKKRGESLP